MLLEENNLCVLVSDIHCYLFFWTASRDCCLKGEGQNSGCNNEPGAGIGAKGFFEAMAEVGISLIFYKYKVLKEQINWGIWLFLFRGA